MRQLTPPTNLVLAVVLAGVLVLSLGLPWYAPTPESGSDGASIESTGSTLVRYLGSSGNTVSGADALETADMILMGLAAATALLALLMAVPALRNGLRDVLKILPLVAPLVVLVQVLGPPDGMEVRYGVFAALAVTAFMANSAFHGAELRAHRPEPDRFTATPTPGR